MKEFNFVLKEDVERELAERDAHIAQLEAANRVAEDMRPFWAKGYTSDSIAAQSACGALHRIWQVLGVTNQTQAILKLEKLVGK